MKDARLYKEAGEHGYALSFRDDGVYIRGEQDGSFERIVAIDKDGVNPVTKESWINDFARRVCRMVRYELLPQEEKDARKAARLAKK